MNIKPLLILTILLVTLPVALAQSFSASAPSTITDLCPCSNQAFTITLENTDAVAHSYQAFTSEAARSWVTYQPDEFILQAGQRAALTVMVHSPCNIEGDFALETFIVDDIGAAQKIDQTLSINACYDYQVELGRALGLETDTVVFDPHIGRYALCSDALTFIPIQLTNNEAFANRYDLFLDAPEWVSFDVDEVELNSGEAGIALLEINTAGIIGDHTFVFSALSELGEVERTETIPVRVGSCLAINVDIVSDVDAICGGETEFYDVVISNNGIDRTNVDLRIEGPAWARLQNSSFVLDADDATQTRLFVLPDEEADGTYDVTINALADDIDFDYTDTLSLSVQSEHACFDTSISARSKLVNTFEDDVAFATVTNNGVEPQEYTLSMDGPSWMSFSPRKILLNPGQDGNVNIIMSPGADEGEGTYNAVLVLESDGREFRHDFTVKLTKGNAFFSELSATLKFYQYYVYAAILLILIVVVLLFVFKGKKTKKPRKPAKKEEVVEKKPVKKSVSKKASKKSPKTKQLPSIQGRTIIITVVAILLFLLVASFIGSWLGFTLGGYILYAAGGIVILLLIVGMYWFMNRTKEHVKHEELLPDIDVPDLEPAGEKKHVSPVVKWIGVIAIALILIVILTRSFFITVFDFLVLYSTYVVVGVIVVILLIIAAGNTKKIKKWMR